MAKNFISKEMNSVVKILDENEMTLDHCISDDAPDRVGDDVNQKGWETKNYFLNPVVLDGHDYSKPPVGKCIKLYQQGGQTRAVTKFAPTEEGRKYFQLYKDGYMSAFSVGFIPKEYDINKTGGYHIEKQELLEYSVVSVPCNPRAVKSYLKEVKGDNEMKKEEVDQLIKSAVDTSIATLTKKHADEMATKVKEIEDLTAKVKDLEENAIVKAGAKISKATADLLLGVSKSIKEQADTLEKCVNTVAKEEPGNDGMDAEKDYSDEEIQKMVAEKVQKAVEAAQIKEEK